MHRIRPSSVLRLPSPAVRGLWSVVLLLLLGCGPKGGSAAGSGSGATRPIGDTLTLTIVPYEAADKLNDEYTPMADYLARKLGKPHGKFLNVVDYAGVLAALQTGQVDVAYLSPLPYALATAKMKVIPLAMPYVLGKLTYTGIIFVKANSPIKTVKDLKGKTVAFGDPSSTSGYLLPLRLLEKHGVKLTDLKRYFNAGDANMVVKAVENGAADAGCAYESVFLVAYRNQPEKARQMRVIAHTEEIPNGIYVARGDMDPADVQKLKQAFTDMNTDPQGRAAMLKAPNDKEVPPNDALFDSVREKAASLHLDLTSLDKKK